MEREADCAVAKNSLLIFPCKLPIVISLTFVRNVFDTELTSKHPLDLCSVCLQAKSNTHAAVSRYDFFM